jgi:hypothetical protein
MTYRERSILRHLDGLFEWTGIPRLAEGRVKPRPRKWSSVLVIVLASVALLLCWITDRTWKMSMALALIGSLGALAAAIRQIGPLHAKPLSGTEDERENLWRSQSQMVGFAVVAIVALIGVLGVALALLFSSLRSMTVTGGIGVALLPVAIRLIGFGQYLLVLLIVVPTLHASWTLPPPIDDEDPFTAGIRFRKLGKS